MVGVIIQPEYCAKSLCDEIRMEYKNNVPRSRTEAIVPITGVGVGHVWASHFMTRLVEPGM